MRGVEKQNRSAFTSCLLGWFGKDERSGLSAGRRCAGSGCGQGWGSGVG
jgi:hypothetical protein